MSKGFTWAVEVGSHGNVENAAEHTDEHAATGLDTVVKPQLFESKVLFGHFFEHDTLVFALLGRGRAAIIPLDELVREVTYQGDEANVHGRRNDVVEEAPSQSKRLWHFYIDRLIRI
jgi:hypothetical protein